jgi:hypothetical protein
MDKPVVGRELDEVIFSEVYGYGRMEDHQLTEEMRGNEWWLNFCATPEAGAMHKGSPPEFSTDITEALAVAEAMARADLLVGLVPTPADAEPNGWNVIYHRKGDKEQEVPYTAFAPTLAEAICHAALGALEE